MISIEKKFIIYIKTETSAACETSLELIIFMLLMTMVKKRIKQFMGLEIYLLASQILFIVGR
jgi:hypothetical protein